MMSVTRRTMPTTFIHLNPDWNAEPNAPDPRVYISNDKLSLEFFVNPWAYEGFEEEQRATVEFTGCKRYRLGSTNDEGWYRGQCRFSGVAPKWGEFYEVVGDLKLKECPDDWIETDLGKGERHFLFYLRDEQFECDASDFEFKGVKA